MKEDTKKWMNKARKDLHTARYLFKGKKYGEAAFFCQQSCEKALKAVLLEKTGRIRKIHDLVVLGKDVHLPEELEQKIKELTLAYIYSRYPDVEKKRNLKGKVIGFLRISKDIIIWAGKNQSSKS